MPTSVLDLINKLKQHPNILGLVEFGADHADEDYLFGDYDVFAILKKDMAGVTSLHFRAGETPIDLNLRTIDNLRSQTSSLEFDSLLLTGRIIYDPTEEVAKVIAKLQQEWMPKGILSTYERNNMRRRHRTIFDKIYDKYDKEPEVCHLLLAENIFRLFRNYYLIWGHEFVGVFPGMSQVLEHIRKDLPQIPPIINAYFSSCDLVEKVILARNITDSILAPIGGLPAPGSNELIALGQMTPSVSLDVRAVQVYIDLFNENDLSD